MATKKFNVSLFATILPTAALNLFASPVFADYAQSLGQSERSIALAGAFTAVADDMSVFYSNPAGATQFERPLIGLDIRLLDTTNVDLKDSAGNHDVKKSNSNGDPAVAPSFAGYYPVNEKWTVGLGFGAPFAITADWTNKAGIHRYSMAEQAIFVIDLVPTAAYQVNEKLSLGLSWNIVAFKHLKTETLIPDTFGNALLAGIVAPPTPDSPVIGKFAVETNDNVPLGVPPGDFDYALGDGEMGFTLGMLYEMNDRWTLGATYRSETRVRYTGPASLSFPPLGYSEKVDYKLDIDVPAFLQIGSAVSVIPNKLRWTLDIQWTMWSDAKGFGKPINLKFQQPLTVPTGGGPFDLTGVQIDYDASDTVAIRTGLIYQLNDNLELLGGYAYDPSFLKDDAVDILVYTSDRHWFSMGFTYDLNGSSEQSGWSVSGSLQYIYYEPRTIKAGESRNLGGLSLPNVNTETGSISPVNNFETFEYGGNLWSAGLQVEYTF